MEKKSGVNKVSDEELSNVSGGACGGKEKPKTYLVEYFKTKDDNYFLFNIGDNVKFVDRQVDHNRTMSDPKDGVIAERLWAKSSSKPKYYIDMYVCNYKGSKTCRHSREDFVCEDK